MARRKTGPRAWVRVSHKTKERKNPRWEVVYEESNPPFKRRTKGGFPSKAAAERWRDQESPAAKDNAGQPWVDPAHGDITFQAVADEWLGNYRSKSEKARGYSQHAQILRGKRSLVRTEFGARRIGDIDHRSVASWLKDIGERRGPSTVRHNFYTFRKVIHYAMRQGLIARDPTVGLTLPEQRDFAAQQAERYALSAREVQALIAATPEPWDMYVRFAAATGMRPEELTGLQLRDVDLDAATVSVRRVRVKAKDFKSWIYEDAGKTPKATRTIDLDDLTLGELMAYLDRHQARAIRWFSEHPEHETPGDRLPLFVGVGELRPGQHQRKRGSDLDGLEYDRPLKHGWFTRRYWTAIRATAALPESVVFYDLRHFHASWHAARLGQPGALSIAELAARLGHASTKMTLDRYVHPERDRSKRNAGAGMWASGADNVSHLHRVLG